MVKRQFIIVGVLALALMLPVVTTAAVVVNNGISVDLHTTNSNAVYLAKGPGYSAANSSNFFGITGNSSKYTNMSIYLNTIPGTGNVTVTNVMEVINDTSATTPVMIYINGTLPSGVTLYFSTSPITYSNYQPSGSVLLENSGSTHITTSSAQLKTSGVAGYFAFVMSGQMIPGQANLNFQYSVVG